MALDLQEMLEILATLELQEMQIWLEMVVRPAPRLSQEHRALVVQAEILGDKPAPPAIRRLGHRLQAPAALAVLEVLLAAVLVGELVGGKPSSPASLPVAAVVAAAAQDQMEMLEILEIPAILGIPMPRREDNQHLQAQLLESL